MHIFYDILNIAGALALVGLYAAACYILGQYCARGGAKRAYQVITNSLLSNQRLAKELTKETVIHRRVADRYREAFDKKEAYWKTVKSRWQDEADKAKSVIARQEQDKARDLKKLKEASHNLGTLEKEYQNHRLEHENAIQILENQCGSDAAKIAKLEASAVQIDQDFRDQIQTLNQTIENLTIQVSGRDEELSKLEEIILVKTNGINELKIQLQEAEKVDAEFKKLSQDYLTKDQELNASLIDLQERSESLEELEKQMEVIEAEAVELRLKAQKVDQMESLQKRVFVNETQLLEKETEIKNIANELDQSKHEVTKLQTELNSRTQRLNALVVQMEDTSEIDNLQQRIGEYEATIHQRDEQISQLKEQLSSLESSLAEQKNQVDEMNQDGALKQTTIDQLNEELESRSANLESLRQKVQELEDDGRLKDQEISGLHERLADTSRLDQLTKELEEFQTRLAEKEAEFLTIVEESKGRLETIQNLERTLERKEQELQHANKELDQGRAEIVTLSALGNDKTELDNLKQKHGLFQGQITEKDSEIVKLQSKLAAEKSALSKLQENYHGKEEELEKLDQKTVDQEGKIEELEKFISEKDSELNGQKEHISNLETELADDAEAQGLRKQIESLKATNENQANLLSNSHENGEGKQEQLAVLERKLGERDTRQQELENELVTSREQAINSQSELDELRASLDKIQRSLDESHEANMSRQKRIDELEHYLKEHRNENGELQIKVKELEQSVCHRSEEILKLNEQLGDKSEVEDVKHQLGLFQSNLSSKESEVSQIKNELKQKIERIADLESELEKREHEVKELNEIEDLLKEKTRTYNLLHNDYIISQEKAHKLQANINDQLEKIDYLESHNTGKQQRIDELEVILSERQNELETLRSETVESSRLDELNAQIGNLRSQLTARETEFSELRQDHEKTLTESEAENDGKHRRITELEGYLRDVHGEKSEIQAALEEKSKLLEELRADTEAKQKRISELDQFLVEKQDEIEGLKLQLADTSETDKLQGIIDTKSAEIEQIRTESKSKQDTISELERQLTERKSELDKVRAELGSTTKYEDLNDQLNAKQDRIENLLAQNTAISDQLATLKSEIDEKRAMVNDLRSEIERNAAEMDTLRSQLSDTSNKASVDAELQSKQSEIELLSSEIAGKQDKISELEGRLRDREAELNEVRGQLSDTSKLDELNDESEAKQHYIDTLTQEKSSSVDQLEKLKIQLDESHAEVMRLRDEASDSSELEALKAKISAKQTRIDLLMEENSSNLELLAKHESTIEDNQLAMKALRDQLSDTSKVDELKKQLREKTDEVFSMAEENDAQTQRLRHLEASLEARETEISALKFEVSDDSKLVTLEDELERTKLDQQRLNDMMQHKQSRIDTTQRQLDESHTEVIKLRAQLADTTRQDHIQNELDSKLGAISSLNKDNAGKQQKIDELELLLESHQEEINTLRLAFTDTSDVDHLKSELQTKSSQLQELTQQLEANQIMLIELEKALKLAQIELEEARRNLSDTSEIDHLKTNLREKTEKLEELHRETENKEHQIKLLSSDLQEKDISLSQLNIKANDHSEADHLKKQLGEKESQIKFLDKSVATSNSRLSELEKNLVIRDEEITQLKSELTDTAELDELQKGIKQRDDKLNDVTQESQDRQEKVQSLEIALAELRASLEAKNAEVSKLQDDVNNLSRESLLASFGTENVEQHPAKGILFTKAPDQRDELQNIFGISADLEGQLNKMGIYRHKQVELWTEKNINHFQNALNFDGSIVREQWVLQAQRLGI